jgi:hypothetical protein
MYILKMVMKHVLPDQKRRERRISMEYCEGRTRDRVNMASESAMAMGSAINLDNVQGTIKG